jgi:hypothetical protein
MTARPPEGLEECDFDTIEDAVNETARGRWFLAEFARRARAADTRRLLDAVARLESLVRGQGGARDEGLEWEQQARAIDERHERLAEIGWLLRERGYDGDICALIEREARALGRMAAALRSGLEPGPTPPPPVLRQAPPLPRVAPPDPEPAPPAEEARVDPPDWREATRKAFAPIDRMTPVERLAFFA